MVRAFSSPTRVTPARPTKRVPLQDIMEETQSAHDDDLASWEERSVIDSLCACAPGSELQLSFSEVNPNRDPSSESESSFIRSHWSTDELQALVQFVLESGKADVWPPSHQSTKVWSAAASFIHRKVGTAHLRTSTYLV